MIKEELDAQVMEMGRIKTDEENSLMDLKSSLENNVKFIDELQSKLKGAYKMMEQLKVKHVEDTEIHNRRLEDTIEKLNVKIQECESLKTELSEKKKLIGQNLSEDIRITINIKIQLVNKRGYKKKKRNWMMKRKR